ncbi:MAG TPA: preprotein translocase subunit SecG [Legionellaceae bacterium]|nr:preprotein translocase subunit SecG [Legionellaceae bacterium]
MYQLMLILHVLIAVTIIGLVLIQHGKGADIGAAFGSGASNTVFGSQGTGSFLFKLTGGLVLAFFTTSVSLSAMVAKQYHASTLPPTETKPISSHSIPIPESVERK